mmetsp:Transcript_1526/g.2095  ORF Transcript_1526/g.2095 Transcript_1526/m.2095 type:complete len:80 (+) Transcript_1526:319-558(+)
MVVGHDSGPARSRSSARPTRQPFDLLRDKHAWWLSGTPLHGRVLADKISKMEGGNSHGKGADECLAKSIIYEKQREQEC